MSIFLHGDLGFRVLMVLQAQRELQDREALWVFLVREESEGCQVFQGQRSVSFSYLTEILTLLYIDLPFEFKHKSYFTCNFPTSQSVAYLISVLLQYVVGTDIVCILLCC